LIARLLSAALFLTAPAALAARTDLPLAASLEVMGRSIVYGVQVDRALNERWAVGLGFSRVNVQSSPDRPDAAALHCMRTITCLTSRCHGSPLQD
jgi:hypothetical protein